jgi:hypothetical protein
VEAGGGCAGVCFAFADGCRGYKTGDCGDFQEGFGGEFGGWEGGLGGAGAGAVQRIVAGGGGADDYSGGGSWDEGF